MTSQLALRRSLAVAHVAVGSDVDGSHGMMTRAPRRRLCLLAGSPERERLANLGAADESPARKTTEARLEFEVPQERRDWANLLPDLVQEISDRLLSLDVAEYLRFRAVCRPWHGLTADPRAAGLLDSRFRPRNWMVLSMNHEAEPHPHSHLLNLVTAASLHVHLPALSTHCHIGAADGLLVLFHKPTKTIRLLDPLTNAVTQFPAVSKSRIVVAVPPYGQDYPLNCVRVSPKVINGAAFDDSTSRPTLILCLRPSSSSPNLATIIFAKPGDTHWTLVSPGRISYPVYNKDRKVLFYTLLSLGGRCYVSSPEGSVYLFELQPLPRLVEVVDQRCFAEKDYIWRNHIISLLVRGTGGRMLMVRCWRGMERFAGFQAYNPSEIFTLAHGMTFRIELLEVDIAGNRLLPVTSLGPHALFLGLTHCLHISTETFPSISADSIYLGHLHQQTHGFGIYHINNINDRANFRRTEAKHKFIPNTVTGDFTPAVRPYNLDEHLVNYVDRSHNSSKPCMNHTSC